MPTPFNVKAAIAILRINKINIQWLENLTMAISLDYRNLLAEHEMCILKYVTFITHKSLKNGCQK